MKWRSWITSDKDEQLEEPVEVSGMELEAESEVLGSGHTIADFQEDIEERENLVEELQTEISRHSKKKKRAIKRVKQAETSTEEERHLTDAKEHKDLKEKKQNILGQLQEEIRQLKKLMLQHLQQAITKEGGMKIDFSELDVTEVESAIEDISDENWKARENINDIDDAIEMADSELGGLDLSDIKEEVNSDDNIGLSGRSLETEEEIDQAIEEELEKIEEMQSDGR